MRATPLACALAAAAVLCLVPSPLRAGDEPAAPDSPPRITSLVADVTLDPETGGIQETVSVTVAGVSPAPLLFRIGDAMVVERSRAAEGIIEHHQAGSELRVFLDPPLNGERRLSFDLSGVPRRGSDALVTKTWAVLGADDGWYPRLGEMWGPSEVTVRVPEGWTAVAPGTRDAASKVWRWRSKAPVRSVAIAAAPGLAITEGKVVTTTLRLASARPMKAEDASRALADPLAWLSGALGPYPFDGFTLVQISDYPGRTQASGMLVAGEIPLATPADGADALAGQWFGQVLAGDGGWMDALAAWEACTYARDRSLAVPAAVAKLRDEYFHMTRRLDVPLSRTGHDGPAEVVRGKGSAAPEMLRLVLGDRAVYGGVVDLFAQGPRTIALDDVRLAVEKRAGHDVRRAFSDWFERADVSQIEASMRAIPASEGGYRVDVTLVQKHGPYALPVEVVFFGPGEEHREQINLEDETTSLFYVLPFQPSRLVLDPSSRVFRWPDQIVTR